MSLVYPANDLDRGRKLLALLGSFWSNTYDGADQVRSTVEGRADLERQNWLNLGEAVRAFSRYEVPIFHEQNWHLWVIRDSERSGLNVWKSPAGIVSAPLLMNGLLDPSVVVSAGVDYEIGAGSIQFWSDPFEDPRWGTSPVFDSDGNQVDTELYLWVFRGTFDWRKVYDHWGYVLGLKLDSSEAYRDLLNAVFDAVAGGTGEREVRLAYAAMTGLPLAKGDETVEYVIRDATGWAVITDLNAYRLPAAATVTASVGDKLKAGDSLCDGLRFASLNRGETPTWVNALVMGRGMLVGRFRSDLVFANADYPLDVTTDEDGYTRVEFPIGGFPLDVEAFWDAVHEVGKEKGQTLAQLLDTRANKTGQPGASNLPSTANPVKFLVENVLRHNAFVVGIKMSSVADDAIGLGPARLLRKIVPPHTALLVLIEVSPETHSVILDRAEDATVGTFLGADTIGAVVGESQVFAPAVSAWSVAAVCR